MANIVKAEDNAKQKTKYFVCIVEARPIFATKWQIGHFFCMNANKAQNPKKKYKKTLTSFIFCIFAYENKIMKQ